MTEHTAVGAAAKSKAATPPAKRATAGRSA